jgi:hypothetical protein
MGDPYGGGYPFIAQKKARFGGFNHQWEVKTMVRFKAGQIGEIQGFWDGYVQSGRQLH